VRFHVSGVLWMIDLWNNILFTLTMQTLGCRANQIRKINKMKIIKYYYFRKIMFVFQQLYFLHLHILSVNQLFIYYPILIFKNSLMILKV
jgi:hypothetical protein